MLNRFPAGLLLFVFLVVNGRPCSAIEDPLDPDSIRRVKGFDVELLRVAKPGEDSWISMCFDNRGRIILGLDKVGVGRLTLHRNQPAEFEKIDDSLKHCRGVLFAFNSIYVNSTDSRSLVRFSDTNNDDVFETRKELISFDYRSRYGHGANQMRLGPDGKIYIVVGNDVSFPDQVMVESPYREPKNDWLLPEKRDQGQDDRVGYILRIDKHGQQREVIAGGLRNPVDMDFDTNGEMFTFDADMEWDIGAPWYRPIRINHIVSGGEYGWRWGTGKWPAYYPDSLPSNLDVGMGSPTGVVFGTKGKFPPRYQKALLIADWQNGKILAAHPQPNGASYAFEFESFLDGAPLNVCDMEFGPDGKLYFITGGRGSQSALYRVSWTGNSSSTSTHPPLNEFQQRRRQLESYHHRVHPETIKKAWTDLGHADPWIRHAARVAIERQPVEKWEKRALTENNLDTAIQALLALVRKKPSTGEKAAFRATVLKRIVALIRDQHQQSRLTSSQLLGINRVAAILFARNGKPAPKESNELALLLSAYFPLNQDAPRQESANGELAKLFVFLNHKPGIEKGFQLLAQNSQSQESQIHLARSLAHSPQPWNARKIRIFTDWLIEAEKFRGGHLLPKVMIQMQADFVASLDKERAVQVQAKIDKATQSIQPTTGSTSRKKVKSWKLRDLAKLDLQLGDKQRGKTIFREAQCATCHRKDDFGGMTGPDLTYVAKRYNFVALLESVIEPSKQIDPKYALSSYATVDGKTYTGRVHGVNSKTITLETDPILQTTVAIQRDDIESTRPAKISPMPTGLLNYFSKKEITDLFAYLLSE